MWTKDQMAKIAAELELKDGMYINLGIGIPTMVANHIPANMNVILQSENGMLGMGSYPKHDQLDADLINAGKETVTAEPGASYFSSSASFEMIRGGHIDVSIIGGMQVSERGDLANWTIPGKLIKGMGGAMDLVYGAKRLVILMEHTTKKGGFKMLKECSLPLTGKACVDRVITNYGVFDFEENGVYINQLADGIDVDMLASMTEFEFLDGRGLSVDSVI